MIRFCSTGCVILPETAAFVAAHNEVIESHVRATLNPRFRFEDVAGEDIEDVDARIMGELSSADPEARRLAVEMLARLRRPEAAPALEKLWDDADPGVRREVRTALLTLAPDATVSRLCSDLSHRDAGVRLNAVRLLSFSTSPHSIGLLTEALADDDPRIRRVAAEALVGLRARSSIPGFRRLLEDPDLASMAADFLCGLGCRDGAPVLLRAARAHPEVRLDSFNGLRAPEAWERLATATLDKSFHGIGPEGLTCLAARAALRWEDLGKESLPEGLRESSFSISPGSGVLETLRGLLSEAQILIEADRLLILARPDAIRFWEDFTSTSE